MLKERSHLLLLVILCVQIIDQFNAVFVLIVRNIPLSNDDLLLTDGCVLYVNLSLNFNYEVLAINHYHHQKSMKFNKVSSNMIW